MITLFCDRCSHAYTVHHRVPLCPPCTEAQHLVEMNYEWADHLTAAEFFAAAKESTRRIAKLPLPLEPQWPSPSAPSSPSSGWEA